MKAVVYEKYGNPEDVLELREVDKPNPKDNEVLVKVHAACVNFGNLALIKGEPFMIRLMVGGLNKPKYSIQGGDFAGQVEAVGKFVKQFKPGDEVYGDVNDLSFGAYAEYMTAPEKSIAHKPSNLSYEEAAAVPQAAVVALQGLRNIGNIQPGQKVLIYGASGGIGTFAVQIAKAFGAQVTGVCSTRNIEMVRSLGADQVIDYTQEDFTQGNQKYDLILATAGYRPLKDYQRALTPKGTYVMAGGSMKQIFEAMLFGAFLSKKNGQTFANLSQKANQDDLIYMKELIEAGKVVPVIDKCYPLSAAAEALRHYGERRTRGKIVIRAEE